MRRRRVPAAGVLAALLLVAVYFVGVRQPRNAEISEAVGETEQLRAQQGPLRKEIKGLGEVAAREAELTGALQVLEGFIPSGLSQPSLLVQLQAAAEGSGVDLVSVTFGDPEVPEGAPATPRPGTVLVAMPVTVMVDGSYLGITDLLRRVEVDVDRAVLVGTVALTEAEAGFPQLRGTWSGQAYALAGRRRSPPCRPVRAPQGAPARRRRAQMTTEPVATVGEKRPSSRLDRRVLLAGAGVGGVLLGLVLLMTVCGGKGDTSEVGASAPRSGETDGCPRCSVPEAPAGLAPTPDLQEGRDPFFPVVTVPGGLACRRGGEPTAGGPGRSRGYSAGALVDARAGGRRVGLPGAEVHLQERRRRPRGGDDGGRPDLPARDGGDVLLRLPAGARRRRLRGSVGPGRPSGDVPSAGAALSPEGRQLRLAAEAVAASRLARHAAGDLLHVGPPEATVAAERHEARQQALAGPPADRLG